VYVTKEREAGRPERAAGRAGRARAGSCGNGIWAVLKIAHPNGGFHLESDGGTTMKDLT
jgi:hypothetical protein